MTDTLVDTEAEVVEGHLDPTAIKHPSWELYVEFWNQIYDIDAVLDAGTESAGKGKITNSLVEAAKAEWTPALQNATEAFEKLSAEADDETVVGTYFGLVRGLQKLLKERADAVVQRIYDAQPQTEDTASDAEKQRLAAERSELMKNIKPIIEMGKMFNLVTEEYPWELPKRRGAVGKRGKRALTDYDWTVNGETYSSVKDVAEALNVGRGEFTKALREAPNDINTKEPPSEFSASVFNTTVSAKRRAVDEVAEAAEPSVSESDDDDDDDSDDEDDDDE